MENASSIALSRLDTDQRAMSVVANNIANASTAGFKSQHQIFSDYLSRQEGNDLPQGAETESYTQDLRTFRDVSQGQMQQTGNPLDLAIGGEGYFSIQTPNGARLTRAGRFERQTDGSITDQDGHALLDRSGQPIRLSEQDHQITISSDGLITTESGEQGQIDIVLPQDVNRMQAEGNVLLNAEGRSTTVERPNIMQGMVESSNVQTMSEMTHMLQIQRDFQFLSQFVQGEDTRQENAISHILQTNV